jgi:NDP-sugar pyrophosphorylase family protein
MKALILAAGRGKRLGPLTADCPKPLLPLLDRPIIDEIIIALRDVGVHEFVVVTGYLGAMIEEHLGDGASLGVKIATIRQDPPQGTGQAVHLARSLLTGTGHRASIPDPRSPIPFLMTYGDIVIAPENYAGIMADYANHPCDLLLGLNWMDDPAAGAAVTVGPGDRVLDIVEKPPPGAAATHWNSAGLMILRPVIFEHTAKLSPSPRGEYELTDAIRAMLASGCSVRAHPLRGFWSDIGTPEDLQRTRDFWRSR